MQYRTFTGEESEYLVRDMKCDEKIGSVDRASHTKFLQKQIKMSDALDRNNFHDLQ